MSLPSFFAGIVVRSALALVAVASALGCAGSGPTMRDLDAEPGALRAWFEQQQSHPRAVLLLSPV